MKRKTSKAVAILESIRNAEVTDSVYGLLKKNQNAF